VAFKIGISQQWLQLTAFYFRSYRFHFLGSFSVDIYASDATGMCNVITIDSSHLSRGSWHQPEELYRESPTLYSGPPSEDRGTILNSISNLWSTTDCSSHVSSFATSATNVCGILPSAESGPSTITKRAIISGQLILQTRYHYTGERFRNERCLADTCVNDQVI